MAIFEIARQNSSIKFLSSLPYSLFYEGYEGTVFNPSGFINHFFKIRKIRHIVAHIKQKHFYPLFQ